MKTLLIILATAGIAFGSAYLIVNSQQSTSTKRQIAEAQTRWQSERNALESALAEAKDNHAPVTTIAASAPAKPARLTPKEILEKLVAIKPGTGAERSKNIRLVVFYLESLTEWKSEAFPVIRDFLAQNQDIDYTTEDAPVADSNAAAPADQNQTAQNGRGGRNRNNNNNGIWAFRRGGQLRTDFVLPPSLRLGLVDVVKAIGGDEGEKILASTLESTGRGIEVAYLAKVLEEIAPGKYRDVALVAAKDLLLHPPAIDSPNRLDELSEGYLFDVLKMYDDATFAETAKTMLIGADGRIDRNVLDYLSSLLKSDAIPALYAAYNNNSLTNQGDKMQLARDVLNYVGENQTANQLFSDIVNNTNAPGQLRMQTIVQLAGGFGTFAGNSPTDPKVIQQRINLLTAFLAQSQDDWTTRAGNFTLTNLKHLLAGEPLENFGGGRGFGGGGQRGNRGNQGGGNNQGQ